MDNAQPAQPAPAAPAAAAAPRQRPPEAQLEAFYMAVLALPLLMQNLLFAIPRDARRLLGTVIWVSLSVITQIFRASFRRHVDGINQGSVLERFNLSYRDFSVHPPTLGNHLDFSSRMTAYVEWAQLTDDQMAIALERARVRRNRADNLPDDPMTPYISRLIQTGTRLHPGYTLFSWGRWLRLMSCTC